MNFKNYSVYYQPQGAPTWTQIVNDSTVEFHHANIANWNTNGLTPGNYMLKLKTKNTLGDSVEALRPIYLKFGVGIAQISNLQNKAIVYPNPSNGKLTISLDDFENANLEIYNTVGQKVFAGTLRSDLTHLNISFFSNGVYQIRVIKNNSLIYSGRVVKE
jgi:hypothetical protein